MKRWYAAAILLGYCIASGGCFRRAEQSGVTADTASAGPADQEVQGWLDRVEGKPRIGANVTVVGWAAAERPEHRIERIEILLDGIEIAETRAGVERTDVADSYSKPDWLKSGWEADLSLDKILPGEHKIEAVASDSTGAKYLLRGDRYITVLDSR